MEDFGYTGGQLVRIDQMSGRDYANAYGPTAFGGEWTQCISWNNAGYCNYGASCC